MEPFPDTRQSLLLRLRGPRDEEAWAEFATIYTPLLYRLATRMGLQEADASDVVQDILSTVARAIDRWDPDPAKGTFRGWLYRIARNLAINSLIARSRHPRGTGDTDVRQLLEAQPAPAEVSAIFDEEYKRRVLAWATDQIRDEFSTAAWRAFWETAVEGRVAKEVADSLGMTVGSVYQYKSRVMIRLRQKVDQFEVLNGRE